MQESHTLHIPGMQFEPENYQQQLRNKADIVLQLLSRFALPETKIFNSPKLHFRMRAEFRIWHSYDDEDNAYCHYAMFEKNAPKTPVRIDAFPIAHQSIAELMQPLLNLINKNEILRKKLFQIEFLSSTTGDLLVSLIYHKALEDAWAAEAKTLEAKLNIAIIGRSRKQRLVLSKDAIKEQLQIGETTLSYLQPENSFSQPNAAINLHMIEWLIEYLQSNPSFTQRDLLEMYCGNGNFSIALAKHFRKVLATEISKTSIKFAQKNCALNDISNVDFIRLSGEETASALRAERAFRRLAHIDLAEYNLKCVLVDPPRAGLDAQSLAFTQSFDTILYISCNPETLAANLDTLSKTHSIVKFALFDQFPYTDHCECGAILKRK